MRRIRYQVAASLDGFIAGPGGEYDWIVSDPDIDFAAHFAQFDTFLMGRRTWEVVAAAGSGMGKGRTVVVSTTLRPEDHPGVEIVARDVKERIDALKAESGKDIWLFGGGELLGSLLALGQVDTVEVAVVPVLLGEGIPLVAAGAPRTSLSLRAERRYPRSGIVMLQYDVVRSPAPASRKIPQRRPR